ncbi:indolepyruvate oxidoreductase subunit beta family protein [Azoarcus sp. KH32C]|uniref:indolepyruvate oxidoreductase subunit beta family protein n=1 Tax=Azoarcus sp. KH32C TaxID=748247 RepID=UPI0002386701|nr:indolepyruvate oxidoreductase subunit beta family protein [Azoarcus sp. KH32C]BAL24199.1 indolepyruvate ferredoxin oxidoreductase, beta subunit [Azoarcus sp. KH32C]
MKPVSILIAALGGEGGGVLADWIIDVATELDFPVQSTSVPGVAQRTGATNYYLEVFPVARKALGGQVPVLSLTPGPGDVDIVAASELIEAGRVMQSGYSDPARTVLVFSTHREFAVSEKIGMGDERYDPSHVFDAARRLARELIAFDMREIAWQQGTIINTVLFGAMVGSGCLPFPRDACEAAIRRSGKAVEASLRGFEAGFSRAHARMAAAAPAHEPLRTAADLAPVSDLPPAVRRVAAEGYSQVLDYQDADYAALYLRRLRALCRKGGDADEVGAEAARHLATWMTYEDIVRVAELKTRRSRINRFRTEVGARSGEPVRVTEFLKPRLEEICAVLPARLARALERTLGHSRLAAGLRLRLRTDTVSGFSLLALLRCLKPLRPRSLRFAQEQRLIERWLSAVERALPQTPSLALELARCGRLIKGYGDTATRGQRSMQLILEQAEHDSSDPERLAGRVAQARGAALADPEGRALARALGIPEPRPAATPVRIVRRHAEAPVS